MAEVIGVAPGTIINILHGKRVGEKTQEKIIRKYPVVRKCIEEDSPRKISPILPNFEKRRPEDIPFIERLGPKNIFYNCLKKVEDDWAFQIIVFTGEVGVGKKTLLKKFEKECQNYSN